LVLDTSVIAAAFRVRNGASYALLNLVAERRLMPLPTPAVFLGYEDVRARPVWETDQLVRRYDLDSTGWDVDIVHRGVTA
jgi:hypothetical protein